MPIQFQCEGCQQPFSVGEELAGKRFKCKKCGQPITVPQAQEFELDPIGEKPAQASARKPSAAGPARPAVRKQTAPADPFDDLPSSGDELNDPLASPLRAAPKGTKRKKGGQEFSLPVPLPYAIGGGVGALLLLGLLVFLFSGSGASQPTPAGPVAVAATTPPVPASNPPTSNPPVSNPTSNPPSIPVTAPPVTPPVPVTPGTTVAPAPVTGLPSTTVPVVAPQPANGSSAASSPAARVPLGPSIAKLTVQRDVRVLHPGMAGFANSRPVAGLRSTHSAAGPKEKFEPLKDGPINLGSWKVQADPLPGDDGVVPVGKKKVVAPVPAGFFGEEIIYATGNARYAALGANWGVKEVREFWDLAEMKKLGSLTGVKMGLVGSLKTMGPDGKYFAASNGERPAAIGIWTSAGRLIKTIPVDDTPEALDFAGPKSLWMRTGAGLTVWKIPTAEKICDIPGIDKVKPEAMSTSPGGKFLVVGQGSTLVAYDLTTGEKAGELKLPNTSWGLEFEGVAWSRDGQALACLYGEKGLSEHQHVLILEVASANLVAHHPVALTREQSTAVFHNRSAATLDWSPDSSLILVQGQFIVGRKAGGPLWTGPKLEFAENKPRRFLSPDRLLFIQGAKGQQTVQEVPLPADEIAKLVREAEERLAAAAKPVKAPEPRVSLAGVRMAPTADAVPWSVTPDPAAPPADLAPWKAIPGVRAQAAGVLFAANAPLAAVWQGTSGPQPGDFSNPGGSTSKLVVDLYDTATGQSKGTLDPSFQGTALAVSPAGDLLLTQTSVNDEDQLDLWSIAEKKSVANWKPYQGETPEFMTHYDPRQVTGAAFVDSQHVFTMNVEGKLVLWSLPDCRPVYQIQKVQHPLLSPGGKYLAVGVGSVLRFYNSRSGAPAGELKMYGARSATAFERSGDRLATVIESALGIRLVIWDLKTTAITAEIPLPLFAGPKQMQWCGPQHVLLDGKHLVDLAGRCVAWRYDVQGIDLPSTPDGRHWYLASGNSGLTLCAIALPEPGAAAVLANGAFPDETIVRPGSEVNLQIGLSATPPNDPTFTQKVTERFQQLLTQNEIRNTPTAPIQLTVGMTMSNTGKNMEFKDFHGAGTVATLAITEVNATVAFVSAGQQIWKSERSFSNAPASFVVRLEPGEDLNSHCSKGQWASAAGTMTNYMLPSHIFSTSAGNGLGKSKLAGEGAVPAN